MNMEAHSVWECTKCGVGKPYNPMYKNVGLCSNCQAYDMADRLMNGYRNPVKRYR